MNDNQPVSRVEPSVAASRLVRLSSLAGVEGDAAREAVVARLVSAGRAGVQTPVSVFSSSI